jgi:hypothetical protein
LDNSLFLFKLLTHMRRVDKLLSIPFLLSKYILFGLLFCANFIHARPFWFQFPLCTRWSVFSIPFFCSFATKSILIGIAFQFPFRASGFYRGNNGWGKPLITQIKYNKVDNNGVNNLIVMHYQVDNWWAKKSLNNPNEINFGVGNFLYLSFIIHARRGW